MGLMAREGLYVFYNVYNTAAGLGWRMSGPVCVWLCAGGRWVHVHTGVPVWLLNSGRGRRRRELIVALAERRTGLPLWHDRITYLSNYAQADEATTTCCCYHF